MFCCSTQQIIRPSQRDKFKKHNGNFNPKVIHKKTKFLTISNILSNL